MTAADSLYFQVHNSSGQVLEVFKEGSSITVGRRSKTGTRVVDLFLDDPYVSRRHGRVFRDPEVPDQWLLEDIGSDNGTRLEGVPVTSPTPVMEGEFIQLGTTLISFSSHPKYPKTTENSDATVVRSREGSAATSLLSQKDRALHGRSVGAQDATIVARDVTGVATIEAKKTKDTMPFAAGADDVTVVAARRADTTVVASGADDVTVVATRRADATVVASGADDVTVVATRRADAITLVTTRMADATLVQPSSTGADGQEVFAVAQPVEPVTATENQSLIEALSVCDTPYYWPVDSVGSLRRLDPLKMSIHSGMIQTLIRAHYLDDIQANTLLETAQKRGQTFFRTLVSSESVQNLLDRILTDVSETFDLEYIGSQEKLTSQVIETDWLSFAQAKELGCVLLRTDSHAVGTIRYAALDPFDITLRDWVERCGHASPRPVLVNPEIFSTVLQNLKGKSGAQDDGVGISIDFTARDELRIRDQIQEVDVPQMVNYFLYRAHFQGASDIHIEPTEEFLLVRLRVDGILHQEISLPMLFHSEMASRLKILSGMDVVEKRRPQDGRLAVVIRNNPLDVRVSSYPTVFGEKFVLRLLDKNALRPSIETLGLMERDRRLLREKLAAPYGLIMISGPTGSGKTTTLYSCLGGMDREKKNVLTVEDPVEYRMAGIHQMQVNSKIGLTFASGLRTILRQDPDVIMVGETRDGETAAMAVQASLTGHIVFSTIHTNTAVGVITRMLDMGIEPFLVSTALSLAVAQRLVRTICKHCQIAVSGRSIIEQLQKDGITKERLQSLDIDIDPNVDYVQGAGCSHCRDTGYSGRRAVFELFEMTDEARSLIMSGSLNAGHLKMLAKKKGMTTLITHGIQLVEEEVTTFEEILRVLGEES